MRLLLAALWMFSQNPQPPVTTPASTPPSPPPAESQPATTTPPAPPPKPVLVNTGKPMKLEAVCADAEISDFGLSCSEDDPCPVYLELSAVEPVGNKLFAAGNFHTDTTTLWSVVLGSDDNGKTWTEPAERIRSGTLDQIQFVDFESGWISGHLALALPRDPFFFKTSDGGKTWRRQPLADDQTIAIIEQFWFDSNKNGTLLLDRSRSGEVSQRYQKFETVSGGDVWSLRETMSKPIAGKRPRGATSTSSEWRLRADASKSYRIEQRQAGKWSPVATFSVLAGACKPAPPPPPPAEPPPSEPPPLP